MPYMTTVKFIAHALSEYPICGMKGMRTLENVQQLDIEAICLSDVSTMRRKILGRAGYALHD